MIDTIRVTPTDEQVDEQLKSDPIPPKRHDCRPVVGYATTAYCSCGASFGFWTNYVWVNRNSRRERVEPPKRRRWFR